MVGDVEKRGMLRAADRVLLGNGRHAPGLRRAA